MSTNTAEANSSMIETKGIERLSDNNSIIALFPGQGSQKVGMGLALSNHSQTARDLFERADDALGVSLSRLCFEGPIEELTKTEIAQPAILTLSTICFTLFKEQLAAHNLNIPISYAAGHSLGEYSALVATGALQFEDAVRLVHLRGKYMQTAVPSGVGKMVAVMGKEVGVLEKAISQVTAGVVGIANDNSIGQVVISGKAEAVDELLALISPAKSIELTVSAPFHCLLMQPAADKLREELSKVTINKPSAPIVANVTAEPTQSVNDIRELLYQQVCGTVRWVESMQKISAMAQNARWIEFGFGSTLAGLMKRIDSKIKIASTNNLEEISSLIDSLRLESASGI